MPLKRSYRTFRPSPGTPTSWTCLTCSLTFLTALRRCRAHRAERGRRSPPHPRLVTRGSFREPSANIGVGDAIGRPPHLTGAAFLRAYNLPSNSDLSYAFTHLDFAAAAKTFGKIGGFAHLATLVKRLRAARPHALLLDGGDSWQGSATALWTQGRDMIAASRELGVELMTGPLIRAVAWRSTPCP